MRFAALLVVLATSLAFTQNNPLPQIAQPLNPTHRAPGLGKDFTINVRGANFMPGSAVNWNGSPRDTAFVSPTLLVGTITAADVATAGTSTITVSNPVPGGGTSDPIYFPIHRPDTSVALARHDTFPAVIPGKFLTANVTGDFNGDGIVDLAVVEAAWGILVFPGTGSGTFGEPILTFALTNPSQLFALDLNHDGNLDLIATEGGLTQIYLGDGTGGFTPSDNFGYGGGSVRFGDFDQDGNVDMVFTVDGFYLFLYRGDGAGEFTGSVLLDSAPKVVGSPIVGDFNRDGKLDILIPEESQNHWSLVMLRGNGDGTFTRTISTPLPGEINVNGSVVGDFNHDGKLDIVADTGLVLLGVGNGSFTLGPSIDIPYVSSFRAADMNNDGNLDIIVQGVISNGTTSYGAVSILLGNGDGTFQSPLSWNSETNEFNAIDIVDTNEDGLLDVVYPNLNRALLSDKGAVSTFLQTALNVSPNWFSFGRQLVGTSSAPQVATLTNTGLGTLQIAAITVNGGITTDYSDTTTCGATLAPGATCTVSITFTPTTVANARNAIITIRYNQATGPQQIEMTGIGSSH